LIQPLLADLLPWVIVFYLVDGVVQPGRGHLVLAGSAGLRPLGAGLRWLGLSPMVEAVALFDLPFLRSGARVAVLDPRRRTEPALIEDADLTLVDLTSAGPLACEVKAVMAGERKLLSAPTPATARQLLSLLRGGTERDGSDLAAARALRQRQRVWRVALRVLATALLLDLLAMAAAAWAPSSSGVSPAITAALFGELLLAIAAVGVGYLRASGEGWRASLGGGLGMLLPWAGLHPLVHLSRPLYRRFDALTAAAALLPAEAFQRLAARELVRARLSRTRTAPELAAAWDERERQLSRLLAATGSSAEAALAPPAPEAGTAAYCPLCRTRYRPGFEVCADCGVPLLRSP
jgi:hypothetical protein